MSSLSIKEQIDDALTEYATMSFPRYRQVKSFDPNDKTLTEKLVAICNQRLESLLKEVEDELTKLCEGCDGKGYVETGGMAMEDDLVEKWPCEDCEERNKALNKLKSKYIGGK